MLFNSIPFFVFYPVVFICFFLLPPKFRWILLLVCSYFFYMYWEPAFIFLLAFCTILDYGFGIVIGRSTNPVKRRFLFLTSIIINLGLLIFFKYFNFLNESLRTTLKSADIQFDFPLIHVLLPIGISFYTFHSVSYIIDIYKNRIQPETHAGKYALFVAFFPLLVAGPIERANHLIPQFSKNDQKLDYRLFVSGLLQVALGFFKKVIVADTLGLYVDAVFGHWEMHSGMTLLLAAYMFCFQIYCDFSGYSDIALGVARMMGYDLLKNFHLPFFSKTITEFWKRWHISLSSWLRDYLYFSMGGNRKGKFKTYRNLFITFLLGGLWHGAAWNFVIWGALHGVYLVIEKILNIPSINFNKNFFMKCLGIFYTFNLFALALTVFRCQSIEMALGVLAEIFNPNQYFEVKMLDNTIFASMLINLALLLAIEYGFLRKRSFNFYAEKPLGWQVTFVSAVFIMVLLFGISDGSQFIYFQF